MPPEVHITLYAAESLTGRSRRTWWRQVAAGTLPRGPDDAQGRATLPWAALAPWLKLPDTPDTRRTALAADAGEHEAQTELGCQLALAAAWVGAEYWFHLAARQGNPEAIHWLAHCHLRGAGDATRFHEGMAWLARAAAAGHPIAQHQLAGWQGLGGHQP